MPPSKPDRLIKSSVNLPSSLWDDLDAAKDSTGYDASELLRACVALALPTLVNLPGLVPALNSKMLRSNG